MVSRSCAAGIQSEGKAPFWLCGLGGGSANSTLKQVSCNSKVNFLVF